MCNEEAVTYNTDAEWMPSYSTYPQYNNKHKSLI